MYILWRAHMNYYELKNGMKVSALTYGLMRFWGKTAEDMEVCVKTALDQGINFFDVADIYGQDKLGVVLERHPEYREKMIIQSKCGICQGYYDLSYEHIMESVNNSLEILHTSYLDVLLLHRPDALMDVEEVAKAFDELYASGKVRHFGVSNMSTSQIRRLQKACHQPLEFNQMQFSIVHALMVEEGINVNMKNDASVERNGNVLDYCMEEGIQMQAWSVLQASWQEGSFIDNPNYAALNEVLDALAKKYETTKAGIAIAWILRHPAHMQPVIGTTSKEHLEELCKASEIVLTRPEWYELYKAVNRQLP